MRIATLIAEAKLDDRTLARALERLRDLDPRAEFLDWIDEGDAAAVRFAGDSAQARRAIDSIPGMDVIVQDEGPRFRRLFVADMDSTIIGQECIDELADYAGLKDEVAAITERAMKGELDFAGALRERVRLLAGMDEATLGRCLDERVRLNPGARTLVGTMRAKGATCLLVSGGFTAFAQPVGEMAGFDRVMANSLAIADGRLSGEVGDPIVDAEAKRSALVAARDELELEPGDVLAAGDGANDRLMIEEAGLGIAYHAKPALAEVADGEIRHHGLHALLWAQGVQRRDWAD